MTPEMTANYASRSPNMVNFPFRDVWSIMDRQKGVLTCASISPSGVWLVSCSQDSSILFVDNKAGVLVGILDLESQFYATAATWRSDTILLFGCSNGVVYHLDIEHKSKRPVSVHALTKPLKAPVRCIAFDTFRDMLAVACGGEVWLYVRSSGSSESWDCVDHILAPCTGAPGLVTALCFFGTTLSCRHLFIGHAKAGWTIWLAPRKYQRTPYKDNGNTCTIGSATIPPSEQFIAIATLDNSLVTYSLHEGGPVIDTRVEVSTREPINYRPVLPIVSTSSDLVLKGKVVGDIEVLDPRTHSTASVHHAHNHIIRTLNAYGEKVVVGSSGLNDSSANSCLRCYTFSSATEPRDWRRIDELQGPVFELTLSDLLPFGERIMLRTPLAIFNLARVTRFRIGWGPGALLLLVGLGGLLVALVLEPPSRDSHSNPSLATNSVGLSGARYSSPAPRNPALSTLVAWSIGYLANRLSGWCVWISYTLTWMLKLGSFGVLLLLKNLLVILSLCIRAMIVVPRLLKETLVELPDLLAKSLCDFLRSQGFEDICPGP